MDEPLPELSDDAKSLLSNVGSLYQHYKGGKYRLMGVARHSETLEEMVVYEALYGEGGIWVRPLKMFLEKVMVDGKEVQRFSKQ